MEDKYMILVDETGQPYIAHAGLLSRFRNPSRQNHKYLTKIGEGTNARYFYTIEELRAYQNAAKRPMPATAKQVKQVAQSQVSEKTNTPVKSIAQRMKEEFRKKGEYVRSQNKEKSSNKAHYGKYSKDDPDFSDANYEKAKSIGDSDFSHFKRSDGTSVILEEDMKWVLPKGVDANNPKIRNAIKQFANQVESARSLGKENYTGEEWLEGVNKAIDEAVEEIQKDNKRSSGR